MKKEIANYIKKFLTSGKPLTDVQAETIAYWELVGFQDDTDKEVYSNEVFTFGLGKRRTRNRSCT